MELFSLLSFVAATAVLGSVGLRMLWIARRTRQVPETAFGITCASSALGAILLVTGSGTLTGEEDYLLWALSVVAMALGAAALYVGVWRIFRIESLWGTALAAVGILALFVATDLRLLPGEVVQSSQPNGGLLLYQVASFVGFAWGSIEGFRYWLLMRRRLVLGLADPLTTHRFLCWAIAAGAAALHSPMFVYGAFVAHAKLNELPVLFLWLQANLLISAVGMWFSFFPPAFYRRRIAMRAADPAPATDPS
jgi:hypothetical protein